MKGSQQKTISQDEQAGYENWKKFSKKTLKLSLGTVALGFLLLIVLGSIPGESSLTGLYGIPIIYVGVIFVAISILLLVINEGIHKIISKGTKESSGSITKTEVSKQNNKLVKRPGIWISGGILAIAVILSWNGLLNPLFDALYKMGIDIGDDFFFGLAVAIVVWLVLTIRGLK